MAAVSARPRMAPTPEPFTRRFARARFGMLAAVLLTLGATSAAWAQNTYTWIATSGTGGLNDPAQWSPTRSAPAATDILVFGNGGTPAANNFTTNTFGQLIVTGNTSVTFSTTSAAALTIQGGTGTDFQVDAGSTVNCVGAITVQISLLAGATGSISGNVNFTGGGHRLTALSTNAITFENGSAITLGTGFTGNALGNGLPANGSGPSTVVFAAGSRYIQSAGANPFALTAPASVVTFQTGSLFRVDGNVQASFSGRTYGDFEYNFNGAAAAVNGSNPVSIDNLTVSQGNFNWGMTGTGSTIKGNITVNTGANFILNPASPATVNLGGTAAQTITNNGTVTVTLNQTIAVNNASGVNLATNLTFGPAGTLNFANGRINTGSNTLAMGGGANVTGASGSTGWVNGNLRRNFAPVSGEASRAFDVGDASTYTPVAVAVHGLAAPFDLTGNTSTPDHPSISTSGLDASKSVNRYWTLTPVAAPSFSTYDATFNFVAGDVDGGANTANFRVKRFNGSAWSATGTGTRTATSTQATGVTAFSDFAVGQATAHTITATAGANGSISPSGAVSVDDGADQTFTITPDPGYHTQSVLVDGVGVVPTNYTFTNVTTDHTISATFAINTYTILAGAGAGGSISPSGGVVVNHGADQSFTITPDAGFHIADVLVDGGSVGAVASYTFTNVTAGHTISASFAGTQHTITASAGAGGAIDPTGAVVVNEGADQLFTITPDAGFHIADVLVDGSTVGAVGTYNFKIVTADHTISASFAINTYTITASAGAGGSIDPSGAVVVNQGADQSFTITANAGFAIADVLVDGGSVGAVGTYTFTNVTADHTISASFSANTFTITASAGAGGSIAPSGAVVVAEGNDQSFTITPDAGFHILDVLVDGGTVGAVGTYTFTNVTADHTIHATFAINTYTITASAGANGSIAPSGAVVVNHGADQSFTITADATYHVADVVVDGSSVGAVGTYTFTNVTADHTIHATFAINTYTITASAGAGGSIAPSGAVIVNHGADQSFTITPNANFNIADVLVDGTSVGPVASYTFTNVTADHTIAASFVATNFTLNVTVVGNGTVTKNPDLPTYTAGSIVQLTAAAPPGFHFAGWSGDASGITNPLSVTMDSNKNITATFLANVYAWNQTGSAAWTTGTNWTPTRFASSTTDVLMFNNGATTTATGIPAQNVAQLLISNNTNITLTVSGGAILNLLGASGDDFTVESGSVLTLNGAASFSIGLGNGATGSVGGRLNANTAGQTITAQQNTNALVFHSGSLVSCGSAFAGNLFGTTNLNSVLFESGSVYAQTSGSNPFGAAQPLSVCTFAAGSLYRLEGTITPSFSGRTYADFEKASAGATSTTGGAALKIDNMVISQGTMNCNMTGQFDLKGNIVVSSGAQVNFLPASGTPAVTFSGTAPQSITLNGTATLSIGTNEGFDIVNSSGVTINSDITLAGRLGFGVGVLHTGPRTLTIASTGTITGASQASGWVDGNLRRNLTPSGGNATRTFDVGDAARYTPVTVAAHGVGAAFDLTAKTAGADHADIANSGINPNLTANRTWTLTPVGSPAFTNYDATFNFTASDLDAGANTSNFVVRRFDGTWHPTTTGARTATSTQATGVTSFSDFAVGELNLYTLNVTVMGQGNVTRSPVQSSYASGTVVTLTAGAAAGWAFQGWSGDITSALNPLAVTMTHNTNLIATFTDIQSPTVTVDSPNGGEKVLVGYMRTISWTAQDNGSVASIDILLSRDGGATYPELIATGVPNDGTYNWIATPPGTADGDDSFTCFIRVVAHDGSGNTAHDESDAGFEIVEIAPTAVAANLPKEFGLSNAWPNPGTRTTIEYAMPREANVKLSIVDIQGREIAVLADGMQPAGRHQVKWDGRTDAGMAASGVYFMRFAAPGRTVVKRFSLAH